MFSRLLVAGIAGTAFLAGSLISATVVTTEFGSTVAYAKNDKSSGKGKSNKSGSNKSSSKGKSASAAGKSKSSTFGPASKGKLQSRDASIVPVSAKLTKKEKIPGLDAKLGALHAMNANINAYIHASPNSRVGKIATYARSLVDVEDAETAVNDATDALNLAQDSLTAAETNLNNALAELGGLTPYGAYTYADFAPETLAARQAELRVALQTAVDDVEIAAINAELQANAAANTNQMAFDEASEAFNEATEDFADAESDLMTAEEDATTALNDAANRTPVDEETRSYVDGQLEDRGILDYFRSEATGEAPEVGEGVEEVEVEPEVETVELD
jgi:hypothetical protein